jgi:dTDP-N-acetylfucosamine:lipid II N-acetylfucosaminyltransferase
MILHVMILDKFLVPFIDFIDDNFGRGEHKYVFINDEEYKFSLEKKHEVEFLNSDDEIFITLKKYMYGAKKIILHGLWRDRVDLLLYENQNLLKKSYWIMWGGDFYFPETKNQIRHNIIKNMGYLITGTIGDYHLVQKWYGAKGKHIKCFNYPSNLYKEYQNNQKTGNILNIQVGNSATNTNNHLDILYKLEKYKNEDIKIFAPLSYGDKEYAKEISIHGKEIFGNKFEALTEFISFDKYLEFLSKIDIALFAHKRQQAFGNIITLLGMGKKVYLDKESTLNNVFIENNIKVFDVNNIELKLLNKTTKSKNILQVKKNYSKKVLINNLKSWLNET